ncbi:D-alanyl-D-alanine carboxypeptidase [Candidatus Wolfebacteria bacterium]|nr:D-alanyl-D-alanine carboxypeptidase [Candidatus Wolfebacteria bacterium]
MKFRSFIFVIVLLGVILFRGDFAATRVSLRLDRAIYTIGANMIAVISMAKNQFTSTLTRVYRADTPRTEGIAISPDLVAGGGDSTEAVIESESKPTLPSAASCSEDLPYTVSAKSFLVRNIDRGIILASRNTNDRWPIASLTKVMSSVIAAETMSPDARVTITEKAGKIEGSAGDLEQGDVFSLRDMIQAMIVASSNRAAQAVAEAESENDFVDRMQIKAHELGMEDTAFVEPTGLSFLNQSTARDLSALFIYTNRVHPDLLPLSRQKEISIRELTTNIIRILPSVNRFAGKPNFIGGKTGYTDLARRNFVGFFEVHPRTLTGVGVNGETLLSIVLGSPDAFAATNQLIDCLGSNRSLANWR